MIVKFRRLVAMGSQPFIRHYKETEPPQWGRSVTKGFSIKILIFDESAFQHQCPNKNKKCHCTQYGHYQHDFLFLKLSKVFYKLAPFGKFRNTWLTFAKELNNHFACFIVYLQRGDSTIN